MKLNHLNLCVSDVAKAMHLFETHFGFTCSFVKGDNMIAALKGQDGFELVLMSNQMNKENNNQYPDAFHIGFMLAERRLVDETYLKLINGGIEVGRAPSKIRDGYGFYFHFDNIMIEVGTL